jgi:nitrate reductase NapE
MRTPELDPQREQRLEWRVFLFLTVFLAPLLSVASILGFGLCVWLWRYSAGALGLG